MKTEMMTARLRALRTGNLLHFKEEAYTASSNTGGMIAIASREFPKKRCAERGVMLDRPGAVFIRQSEGGRKKKKKQYEGGGLSRMFPKIST